MQQESHNNNSVYQSANDIIFIAGNNPEGGRFAFKNLLVCFRSISLLVLLYYLTSYLVFFWFIARSHNLCSIVVFGITSVFYGWQANNTCISALKNITATLIYEKEHCEKCRYMGACFHRDAGRR